MTSLVPPDKSADDLETLRSRLAEREAALDARSADVEQVKADLGAFRLKYRHDVGTLHEQLDKLELAIDEAELDILSARLEGKSNESSEVSPELNLDPAPKLTTDAVRKLFRDVAKAIHPDLAHDDLARERRHLLMVEANRAYALGDEEQLRSILQSWERSPEAVQGSDPEAMRLRVIRRIDQIDEQLEMLAADLADMKDSPLWKLKTMVDEEAAKGKDLIADMVRRLKRDILVATNRLDALRPPG